MKIYLPGAKFRLGKGKKQQQELEDSEEEELDKSDLSE